MSKASTTPVIQLRQEVDARSVRVRKYPQQQRSRMLVESVKQACRIILESEGAIRLSATQLSRISGVAVGSIYQYFPNLQAVVAAILVEDARCEIAAKISAAHVRMQGYSLEQVLREMVRNTLAFYRRILKMDAESCRALCEEFDLDAVFNMVQGDPEGTTKNIVRILRATRTDIDGKEIEMRAFLVTRILRSAVLATIKSHPEYLATEAFENSLVDMALVTLGATVVRQELTEVCH